MTYILDDTEVNTPVYAKLLRPSHLHKPRRSVLALRVKRLEVTVRVLQEKLLENSIPHAQIERAVTEASSSEAASERAESSSQH